MTEHPSLKLPAKTVLEQLGNDTKNIQKCIDVLRENVSNVNSAFESLDALEILGAIQSELHGFISKYTEVLTLELQNAQEEAQLISDLRDKLSKV